MARNFKTKTPSLPPLRGGADIIQCTVTLRPTNYALPMSESGEEMPHSTLLVSFLPKTSDRLELRTLRCKFFTGTCDAFFSAQPAIALPSHFAQQAGAFAMAVIALPPSRSSAAKAVQSTLHAIHNNHHLVTLVVGLSADPAAWGELEGVSGWVKCEEGFEATAASQLFVMIATLMSEETLNCIDDSDVENALGSSTNPARLQPGVWISALEKIFWVGEPSERSIGISSVAVAFALAHRPTISDTGNIYRAIRAIAPHAASVQSSFSSRFLAPELLPGVYPVVVLWRT